MPLSSTAAASASAAPVDSRLSQSQARARRRSNLSPAAVAEIRCRDTIARRQIRATADCNRQNQSSDLVQLSRSMNMTPSSAMLQLYEIDPYIAALAFADGSGFNANHIQLTEDLLPTAEPNFVPVSPANHVKNVLDFQRDFCCDQPIVACASCGMTSFEYNDERMITLMSAEGSVFRVQESHPLFQKYKTILDGPFPTDIQYFTVHVHRAPGTPLSFYHLHSDLLVDATESTIVNDKLIYLCKECNQACRKKKPVLPFFNPANGYDFGKIPVGKGNANQYPFNLTLAEQIVCAKCISQQTHIKFNATEEIGVQGHVVCHSPLLNAPRLRSFRLPLNMMVQKLWQQYYHACRWERTSPCPSLETRRPGENLLVKEPPAYAKSSDKFATSNSVFQIFVISFADLSRSFNRPSEGERIPDHQKPY